MKSRTQRLKEKEKEQKKEKLKEEKRKKLEDKKARQKIKKVKLTENNSQEEIEVDDKKRGFVKVLLFLFLLIAIVIIYARYVEPKFLKVHEYTLETSKPISENFNGLQIVHFSDLHYGSTVMERELINVVDKINKIKPDIVIFTGDLVEDNYELSKDDIKIIKRELLRIETSLGKYAIYGNHDINNKYFETLLSETNFMVLKNSYDLIYNKDNNPILIYGLEDTLGQNPNFDKLLEVESIPYKIILVHEPDYINEFKNTYSFDLILSGHSHNGQFRIPYVKPLYLPNGSKELYKPTYDDNIFISNGIGTSRIKLRLGSIPSINLYRVVKIK